MKKIGKSWWIFGIVLLNCFIAIRHIFISIDVDEIFEIVEAYRFTIGDIPFQDIQDAHMFSGIIMVPFVDIWTKLFGTDYIVVYIRIISLIIRLLIVFFILFTLKRCNVSKNNLLIAGSLIFAYCTKKIYIIDYANVQCWALVIICCMFINYNNCKRKIWLILAGIMYSLLVLVYPAEILVLLSYVLGYRLMDPKKRGKNILIFVATCFACAVLCIIWLLSKQSLDGLIENISVTFSNVKYTGSLLSKVQTRFWEGISLYKVFVPIIVLASLIEISITFIKKTKFSIIRFFEYASIISAIYSIAISFVDGSAYHFWYLLFLTALGFAKCIKEKNYFLLVYGIIPGCLGFIATLLSSVVSFEVCFMVLFVPALEGLWVDSDEEMWFAKQICAWLFLGIVLFENVFFIRESTITTQFYNISNGFEKVTYGPLKGIYYSDEEYPYYEEFKLIADEYINEGDKLMYYGWNEIIYLMKPEIGIAVPSITFDDPGSAGHIIEYCESQDSHCPNIIVINKNYHTNNEVREAYWMQPELMKWIYERYQCVYESETVIVYK